MMGLELGCGWPAAAAAAAAAAAVGSWRRPVRRAQLPITGWHQPIASITLLSLYYT